MFKVQDTETVSVFLIETLKNVYRLIYVLDDFLLKGYYYGLLLTISSFIF